MPATKQSSGRRAIAAWCVYDWANSSFPALVSTFIFAPYFARAVVPDDARATALWAWALAASGLVIAVGSPILGAVADASGRRKPWLGVFTALCVATCALLWFVPPAAAPVMVVFALVTFAVANASFEFATVFYNAMLPAVAPAHRIGRVSGWGWGLGYAGGVVSLVLVLFLFVRADPAPLGLDRETLDHVRIATPFAGLWYALFAVPFFLIVPEGSGMRRPLGAAARAGLRQLKESIAGMRRHANAARYLLAHLIYTDGLITLFAFGGIYAAGTFGMTEEEVIVFGIALNVTAGIGAAAFAWIDDWIGPKRTILIALVALTAAGTGLLLVESKAAFWPLALILGAFFGPAQAASRSLMVRLAPPAQRAEMFGLYALSGKATAFLGPLILGIVTQATGSQRLGMATIIVFFLAGIAVLLGVREPPPVSDESGGAP